MIDADYARRLIAAYSEECRHNWEMEQRRLWCNKHGERQGQYGRTVYPPLSDAPASALKPYPGTPPFILLAWGGTYLDTSDGWMIIESAKYDKLSARRKKRLFPYAVIMGGGGGR